MISEESFNRKDLFFQALKILSQSSDLTQRKQANDWLYNMRKVNIIGVIQLIFDCVKNPQIQPESSSEQYQILSLCYLEEIIQSGEIAGFLDLPQKFYDLYSVVRNNHKISGKVLECFSLFLNAYGNKRIKNQYLNKFIKYLTLNYPHNLSEEPLEMIAKILCNPQEKNQIATGVGQFAHTAQKFIRVYSYENVPNNIPSQLWFKVLLGLVNYSTIVPPFRFIVNGIRLQNEQNVQNINLEIYSTFLKLYLRTRCNNDICDQDVVNINLEDFFYGIISKISTGIFQRILANDQNIELVQVLLKALHASFLDCLNAANQDQQIKKYLIQRNLLNQNCFYNIACLLTSIFINSSKNSFEEIAFNKSIKQSVCGIFYQILHFQINGQTAIWVEKYIQNYILQSTEDITNLLYFFTILPRQILQSMSATDILQKNLKNNNYYNVHLCENTEQLQCLLLFVNFLDHYIDLYEYLENNQILISAICFCNNIISCNIPQTLGEIHKYCYLKASAVKILCKMEKYNPKKQYLELFNFYEAVLSTSTNIILFCAENKNSNCSELIDGIIEGFISLAKLSRYSQIVYIKSIQMVEKIFVQIQQNAPRWKKQTLAYFASQIISLISIVISPENIENSIFKILSKFFKQMWCIRQFRQGLEQSILELTYKIIYSINSQINEETKTIQYKNNALNYLILLENNTQILDLLIQDNALLIAQKNVLILYTRIILQLLIHSCFIDKIKNRMLFVYRSGKDQQQFDEIFCITNIIWQAAYILYDQLQGLQQLRSTDFYHRITQIKSWDLEHMLQKLTIDPEIKEQYARGTKQNNTAYRYKWSKLPQVKNVIFYGSVVPQIVDKKLQALFI